MLKQLAKIEVKENFTLEKVGNFILMYDAGVWDKNKNIRKKAEILGENNEFYFFKEWENNGWAAAEKPTSKKRSKKNMKNYSMMGLFLAYNARLPKNDAELTDFYKKFIQS